MNQESCGNFFRLASHLNAFSDNCVLPWDRVHSLADEVIDLLKRTDPEYYQHLQVLLSTAILLFPKFSEKMSK